MSAPSSSARAFVVVAAQKPASAVAPAAVARAGILSIPGRPKIPTPTWIPTASRGAVPHLSPDNLARHGRANAGIYFALEDFIEKTAAEPPIYSIPPALDSGSRLSAFAALPATIPTVLAPRRPVPVPSGTANTATSISVCTSVGFRDLSRAEYVRAVRAVRPDVAVLLTDTVTARPGDAAGRSRRRMETMAARSAAWVTEAVGQLAVPAPLLLAPLLPIPFDIQRPYVEALAKPCAEGGVLDRLAGIVLPSHTTAPNKSARELRAEKEREKEGDIAGAAAGDGDSTRPAPDALPGALPGALAELARFSVTPVETPHALLALIRDGGGDVFVLPFVTRASEAGVALTFVFRPTAGDSDSAGAGRRPLGISLWDAQHATALRPLGLAAGGGPEEEGGCDCYACTRHHRAYIRHLLDAREMLAWTLLQIHNQAVLARFFADVRAALVEDGPGGRGFAALVDRFGRCYEDDFPGENGAGPRTRGYQMTGDLPGEAKRNKSTYGKLDQIVSAAASE